MLIASTWLNHVCAVFRNGISLPAALSLLLPYPQGPWESRAPEPDILEPISSIPTVQFAVMLSPPVTLSSSVFLCIYIA